MKRSQKISVKWCRWVTSCGLLGALLASPFGCARMKSRAMQLSQFRTGIEPPLEYMRNSDLLMGVNMQDLVSGGGDMAAGYGAARGGIALGRRVNAPTPPPSPEATPPPPPPASAMTPGGGVKETQPPPIVDATGKKRLVIYTAQFSILVAGVEDSMKALLEKIKQWDGYVQTSDLKRVTFRVPAASFDRVVQEISQMGVVTDKKIQAEDVTRQYMDLDLRIQVAETSLKRLLALLEKAQKTEDLLKIENEVRRLTEEIERMKAEFRTLADQIAYSTITVEFTAKAAEAKQPRPRRGGSYFNWINQIGAENVTRFF